MGKQEGFYFYSLSNQNEITRVYLNQSIESLPPSIYPRLYYFYSQRP